MRAAHHHAVQCGGMLGNVDADGSNLDHSSIVCFQPSLGAIQGLGFGNAAFHHSSNRKGTGFIHTPFKTVTVLCYNGFLSVSQIFKYSYVILFISYIHIPFSFTLHTQMHYMPQKTTLNLRELQVMHCKSTC